MRERMRILAALPLAAALLLTADRPASPQAGGGVNIISQRRFARIMPEFQRWTPGDATVSQFSIPITAYLPLRRDLGMTFLGSRASASGDDLPGLAGLTDTQFKFNYYHERSSAVVSLGVNLPTGKDQLSADEFATSSVVSQSAFSFRAPGLGQGFNLSTGATWARPVREDLVLGGGASMQFRGAYEPLSGIDYNPANELLLTGGIEKRLSETESLSGDVILTFYGTDKVNGEDAFSPATKIVLYGQYRRYVNFDELWVMARFRGRGRNQVAVAGGDLTTEDEKTTPNQLDIRGRYRQRLSEELALAWLGEIRWYEDSAAPFDGARLLGVGVAPDVKLNQRYRGLARAMILMGKLEGSGAVGLELGVGVMASF